MSLSGRFVVFESLADNIAGGNPGTAARARSRTSSCTTATPTRTACSTRPARIDTQLVSGNPCGQNLTNHSIEPSITYDGRFVVFATVAGNAKVDGRLRLRST